jgi:SAM-dependent methyltransferase
MSNIENWVPTPTFLYRNYLYEKIISKFSRKNKYLLMGVGTGYFLNKMESLGFQGKAIDISTEAIKIAKLNTNPAKTDIQFGDILKYKNNKKYDLVLSFEVLEHIKDDQLAINNIHKLLKNNGTFVFSVPAHMSKWGEMDTMGGHFRRYERHELIQKLKVAEFKIKTIWTFGFPFLNLVQSISRTGFFTRNNLNVSKTAKTKKSGIRLDYDPKFRFLLSNNFILTPMFKLLDLFVTTDRGLGYIVVAKKTSSKK